MAQRYKEKIANFLQKVLNCTEDFLTYTVDVRRADCSR